MMNVRVTKIAISMYFIFVQFDPVYGSGLIVTLWSDLCDYLMIFRYHDTVPVYNEAYTMGMCRAVTLFCPFFCRYDHELSAFSLSMVNLNLLISEHL